jgi:predicted Zn-dependent peptidase
VQTRTLPNGLTVIMLPRPGSPFHTAVLGFRSGAAQATPPGVVIAARWGRRRTTDSPELSGLRYRYQVTGDSTLEVLQSTGSDVAQTINLLGQQLGHETFWPPQRFIDLLDVFEREEKTPELLFERAFGRAFFGSHLLGQRPTVGEIQRVAASDVLNWVHRVRRPRNAAVVIVGDFDPAEAVRNAELQFADWDDGGDATDVALPATIESRASTTGDDGDRLVVQDRPGSLKASLRLRCALPRFTADKLAAHAIFEEAVERTLTSELRQQLGASYDVSSRTAVLRGGTAYYELEADADYERLGAALRSARDLLRRPSAAFEDPARFDELRALAIRRRQLDTQAAAGTLFELWNLGWPLDAVDRIPEQARRVRAAEVRTIADRCAATWVLGVLGDASRVRAAWRAAQSIAR